MQVLRLDRVFDLEPAVVDLELGNGRRGARPPELESALVELENARDGAALPVRADLQRTGDSRSDIVAVEQKRLAGVERQVERGPAAGEGRAAAAGDAPAAGRLPG